MELIELLDEQTRNLIQAGFDEARERPVTLRANTLKSSIDEVCSVLEASGVGHERVPWYADALVVDDARERDIWDLDVYRDGCLYLQSLSSMLPPLLMEPRPGVDILDMCAAPGGKTAQIAALTGNAAHLTACEMSNPRADKLVHNLEKLGVANVNVMRTDARRLDEFFSFDQILLDAPCTGTGTYRRGDERAEKRMTRRLLAKVVKSQRALLDRALTILKPGGTLIYSTCSVLAEENDDQVRGALKRHRDCEVMPIFLEEAPSDDRDESHPIVLEHASQGPCALPVLPHPNALPGTLTIAPTRLFEGFFVAAIRKKPRR